jgi:hypothetical protein
MIGDDINRELLSRIRSRMERPGHLRATALEPEVRTPIDIVPVAQPENTDRRDLPELDTSGPLLGPLLLEWQYNVRLENINAFHDWLVQFESKLQQLCPNHFRYLGTFEAPFGANWEAPSGRYRTLWQHADLAGTLHLLRSKRQGPNPGEEDAFFRLLNELTSFQDTDSSVRSSQLYQLVTNR